MQFLYWCFSTLYFQLQTCICTSACFMHHWDVSQIFQALYVQTECFLFSMKLSLHKLSHTVTLETWVSLSPPYPYPTTFINFWNPILTTDLPNDFYFPFVLPASFTYIPATASNLLALQSVYIHQQKDFKNVNWVTSPICIQPFMGLPLHLKETSNCLLWP